MKFMKYMLVVLFCTLCLTGGAANVRWNFVDQYKCDDGEATLQAAVNGVSVSLFFTASAVAGKVKLSNATCNLATRITWVSMAADDIVDASAFGNGMASLFSTEYSGASGEMTVDKNESFYMAFQAYELVFDIDPATGQLKQGDAYYGWVEFYAKHDGNVELLGSAIDADGDGMIVGGGSVSIPEPSGGVLVLLGVAALALRRRI